MKQKLAALAVASFGIAACSDVPSTATLSPAARPSAQELAPLLAAAPDAQVVPNRYIVVFRDNVADPHGRATIKAAKFNAKIEHAYGTALKGFSAELSSAAVQALRADPDVAFIEPDQVMRVSTTESGATWGIDRIDQRSLPLSGSYTYSSDGTGVTAYIIDTGILFAHTEFGGRASTGVDEVTAGGTAQDCNGHGTHVSGTVGGATYGVAKNV